MFQVLVDIAARTASLETGVKQAVATLEGFQRSIEQVASVAEASFAGMSLISFTEKIVEATMKIEELAHEAEKAGVGIEAFQQLSYAAKTTGVSAEALGNAFKFMNKAIGEAEADMPGALQKFMDIGVQFDKIKGLSPERQFQVIAQAISEIKDPAERTKAELELFGRAGSQLAPLLNEGAVGIANLRQRAIELGQTLDKEQTEKAAAAAKAIKDLQTTWESLTQHLTVKAAPALQSVAIWLRDMFGGRTEYDTLLQQATSIDEAMATFKDKTAPGYIAYANELEKVYKRLAQLRGDSAAAAKQAADDAAAAITHPKQPVNLDEFSKSSISRLKIPTDPLDELYKQFDKDTQTTVEKAMGEWDKFIAELNGLGLSSEEAQKRYQEALDKFLPPIEVHATYIRKQFKTMSDDALHYGREASDALTSSFQNFFDGTTKGLGGLVQSFAKAFERIIAEAAARNLMKAIFGSSGGADAVFGGIFSSLFGGGGAADATASGASSAAATGITGLATGGQFTVGGSGGTDSTMVAFRGTPGEKVVVSPTGGGRPGSGGMTIHNAPVFNIDSRSDRSQIVNDVTSLISQSNQMLVRTLIRYNPGIRV